MADFCKQCSERMFGRDCRDLANLMPPENYTADEGAGALCECCGYIVVDVDGKRMSDPYFESCTCH